LDVGREHRRRQERESSHLIQDPRHCRRLAWNREAGLTPLTLILLKSHVTPVFSHPCRRNATIEPAPRLQPAGIWCDITLSRPGRSSSRKHRRRPCGRRICSIAFRKSSQDKRRWVDLFFSKRHSRLGHVAYANAVSRFATAITRVSPVVHCAAH